MTDALVEGPAGRLRALKYRGGGQTGDRKIWLDGQTAELLRGHRKNQLAARLRAGADWQDDDLIFCRDDGTRGGRIT